MSTAAVVPTTQQGEVAKDFPFPRREQHPRPSMIRIKDELDTLDAYLKEIECLELLTPENAEDQQWFTDLHKPSLS